MLTSEKKLIDSIRRAAGASRNAAVRVGVGDDSAVLRLAASDEALITTDFSLEGVHFRREWHPAGSIGHRCLTRGLSDIAAMGGEPLAAFVSLALPPELGQEWVDSFIAGLLKLAGRFKVQLAGGDIAQSPSGVLADIMVLGRAPKGRALLRSGARPGDSIYVTGELGRSAAVLLQLRQGARPRPSAATASHFFPEPRIAVGRWLLDRKLVSACIDVSDGLSTDLSHICDESGVGALVAEHSIPRPSGTLTSSLHLALHGGEDYELLFTAPRSARILAKIAGVRVTRIGEIIQGKKMYLTDSHGQRKELRPGGWQHFGA